VGIARAVEVFQLGCSCGHQGLHVRFGAQALRAVAAQDPVVTTGTAAFELSGWPRVTVAGADPGLHFAPARVAPGLEPQTGSARAICGNRSSSSRGRPGQRLTAEFAQIWYVMAGAADDRIRRGADD
jgi:hypothetical protein